MKLLLAGIASASAWQNGYVIGGNVVAPNSEPHILSLQRSSHFCGGTVVSATHGMTAAHCYYSPSIVNAVAGAHNIKQNESTQQKVGLTKFQRHPNYNSNNISNDVAVLEFASSLTLNEYVVPAKLPAHTEGEWMSENDVIHVCGWGNTLVIGSNYPAELHCVDTLYVPVSKCNAKSAYNGSILPGMFCAGELGIGGKDACQGDSGGPIMRQGECVGATSWGYGCAYPNYPGVYTDVANYRNWVDENTQ